MSSPNAPRGIEQAALLAEVSWIRRLAGELVADRELAEDLVQETCVAALEHAPREHSKLRQWLAEVLRNALRQHARAQGRRSAREAASARPEALEATDRLVERVALQRELVGAVLALDEPYRTAVLLRFFEELPPRAIAARLDVPIATVQSRLTRALAKLRAELDRTHGPQGAWALLLAPPASLETLATPLLPLVMKTKLALAVAGTALAAGAYVWWSGEEPERAPLAAASAPDELTGGGSAGDTTADPSVRRPAREPLTRPAPSAPAEPLAPAWSVRLRVLDADGEPLAGLAVRAENAPEVLGTSVAGGWCLFETRAPSLSLVAADPRWVTLHAGAPAQGASLDPVLVAAPALELGGHVRDEQGRTLSGAALRFVLPEGFHARFSEVLEASAERRWRTRSGPDGSFRFEGVPAVREARLTAVLAGYELGALPVPEFSDPGLELVLKRPRSSPVGGLTGLVLDGAGEPVPGARVALGLASVTSDPQGEFALDLARAVTSDEIVAAKEGFLPARLERPGRPEDERAGWPARVELVLPGPALALSGRVVDHEGRAVPGARVWLHDPTPGAPVGQLPTTLEAVMGGAPVPARALESIAHLPETDGDDFSDSRDRALEPDVFWNWVTTDGSGAFELVGLEPRRYRLDVLRPDMLDVSTSEPFEAGTRGVLVRLAPPELFPEVRGRVVDEDGEPVAGVALHVLRPMVDVTARIFGGSTHVVRFESGARTTSDTDGRFLLRDVPRSGTVVTLRGEGIVPSTWPIDAAELELAVEQRCHLEVVLREPVGRYERMQVLDGDGRPLDLLQLTEGSTSASSHAEFVAGRTGVYSVSARARTLRLLRGEEAESVPLDLAPGTVNRLEL